MAWLVRFEGEVLNTEDLTLDELEAIETVTGTSWVLLNPWQSMKVAKALLAVALTRSGVADEVAREKIGGLTSRAIQADTFTHVEDGADLPTSYTDGQPDPKAAAEPETSGSSGPTEPSAGTPT